MSREALSGFLRGSNLMSGTIAAQIAETFTYKSLQKNELQLCEGKICDEYMYLTSGYMRSFAHDTDGNDVTTDFYQPGQMVFEVSSLFSRIRSMENIQALTDCEGWYISFKQLNELFHTLPEFREFGRAVLVKGFTALKTRTLSMITETAEERYERLVATNAAILQHAPLKNIASYLGVTDTSLSRIRKELSRR